MVPYTPHPPAPHVAPNALACPRCKAYANPSPAPQACSNCRAKFTLTAGPAIDPHVIPAPPPPSTMKVMIRWSVVVTYQFAALDAFGVSSGTLDPVVGIGALDPIGLAYSEVASIGVWRRIAWAEMIVGLLVPLPLALFLFVLGLMTIVKAPTVGVPFALFGIVLGVLAIWMIRRGFVVGRRFARIVGPGREMTIRFDKSPAFYDQLFRRCGLMPAPLP